MENFIKDAVIGSGAYGTVYKVTCRNTGKAFALKQHMRGVEEATVRERSCLSALRNHPYVIQILDCFVADGLVSMLMPLAPYTLSQVIHNGDGLNYVYGRDQLIRLTPFGFVARFSVQVANALSYMHRLNFIHRDLTPSNVLLTDDFTVKVADMGLSRHSTKVMSPNVVTVPYRAPEVFVGHCEGYTCAIDMWSLGVMIADAMEGRRVFSARKTRSETVSTYQIIVRTLCPKDHPSASVTPWEPVAISSGRLHPAAFKYKRACADDRRLQVPRPQQTGKFK
ncbi:hypothetical protein DPEC_G00068220 [Dallia pectoralis]|uniref:Uncharacterized protein n=1 Tax=Dallia pectoralis TaxID=75939 RepID=A0ACC2H229_DALPE|nr:hypothetical protein DPEC_G00068220 [Dallia pectoralis]